MNLAEDREQIDAVDASVWKAVDPFIYKNEPNEALRWLRVMTELTQARSWALVKCRYRVLHHDAPDSFQPDHYHAWRNVE
ncbi:hypothetical protein SCOR_15985 [Sulfidibacter corallicola]|uniref:Uncharacterized protein n=1 Tax=Sulfidibacter corallicola TaxID=2818388 RepID=A0A8A4TY67_SULCO|nr:hypothetical protein [Sulfidibacter corallicola]QTD54034.1 hypothetical protein J3U87_16430 [Sulfidibacter corallicola]